MSDVPLGEGWWIASDGRWYPPNAHPDALAKQSPPGDPHTPPAEGWWKASDGNWYAPELHPNNIAAMSQAPWRSAVTPRFGGTAPAARLGISSVGATTSPVGNGTSHPPTSGYGGAGQRNGVGNGYGNGVGNGYGNGVGNGYGNGVGNGYGNGVGSGYGTGHGVGNGYGTGHGVARLTNGNDDARPGDHNGVDPTIDYEVSGRLHGSGLPGLTNGYGVPRHGDGHGTAPRLPNGFPSSRQMNGAGGDDDKAKDLTLAGSTNGVRPTGPANGFTPTGSAGGSGSAAPLNGSASAARANGFSPAGPANGFSPAGPANGFSPAAPSNGSAPAAPSNGSGDAPGDYRRAGVPDRRAGVTDRRRGVTDRRSGEPQPRNSMVAPVVSSASGTAAAQPSVPSNGVSPDRPIHTIAARRSPAMPNGDLPFDPMLDPATLFGDLDEPDAPIAPPVTPSQRPVTPGFGKTNEPPSGSTIRQQMPRSQYRPQAPLGQMPRDDGFNEWLQNFGSEPVVRTTRITPPKRAAAVEDVLSGARSTLGGPASAIPRVSWRETDFFVLRPSSRKPKPERTAPRTKLASAVFIIVLVLVLVAVAVAVLYIHAHGH